MSVDVYIRTGLNVQVTPQASPTYYIGNLPVLTSTGQQGATKEWVDSGYYPRSNPSGYATGIDGSLYVRRTESGQFVTTGQTGNFVTTSQTGSFAANTGSLTGVFYPLESNPSGYLTSANTGAFVTTGQTGSFAANTGMLTGVFYPLDSNPSGYLTTINTGAFVVTGQTGQFASVTNLNATGAFLQSEISIISGTTGSFITTSQTGQFSTTGHTHNTGAFVVTGQTGQFASALNLASTGAFLQSEITIISGTTGSFITTSQTGQFASANNLNASGAFLQSEIVVISGTTGAFITTSQTGQFVGTGSTGSHITTGQTGAFASTVNLNGTGAFLQSEIIVISGTTGSFITTSQTGAFFPRVETGAFYSSTNPAGYITSAQAGGVSAIQVTGTSVSGVIILTGIGGTVVAISGSSTITISGGGGVIDTGSFITTGQTGDFAPKYLTAPSDGTFGGPNGPIAGIQVGDSSPDAFDKIEVVLGKLAPPKPLTLAQSSFVLTGTTYSAFMQGTATQYTGVQATQRPTGYATGFYDGDAGILSGFINGLVTGYDALTTGIDTGNYSGLVIYADFDYWSGVAGRAGFWSALNARVSPLTPIQSGIFTLQMKHSTAGDTRIITGYCDVPTAAASLTLTNSAWVTGTYSSKYIDGVPTMNVGDQIKVSFTGGGAVTAFYSSPIARLTSAQITTNNILPTLNPVSGASMALSGTGVIITSTYSTGVIITGTLYNSISGSNTATVATNVRVDTTSVQQSQRRTAASGQFPTLGNEIYDNTGSFAGNEELQMIAGIVQYPPKVNYGSFVPAGPNYANIPSGSYQGHRWIFYNFGNLTNVSNIIITYGGTANFGATPVVAGMQLYIKVSGGTAGWVDGNAAYGGVGNPTNNGDAALVVASSTATSKYITFGSASLSGPLFIRIGLPSGTTKTFTGISYVTA